MNATLGTDMEYIFSHSTMAGSTGYYEDPWAANQVSQQRSCRRHSLIPALQLDLLLCRNVSNTMLVLLYHCYTGGDCLTPRNNNRAAGMVSKPLSCSPAG